jgi:hypothetical protein
LYDATFIVRHCTARLRALGTQKDPHKNEDGHQGEEQYATHNLEHFHSAVPPQFLKSKYYLGLFARDLPEASLGSYRGLKLSLGRDYGKYEMQEVAAQEPIGQIACRRNKGVDFVVPTHQCRTVVVRVQQSEMSCARCR